MPVLPRQAGDGQLPVVLCVDVRGGCDGLWVDASTFEPPCARADEQAALLHQFSTHGPAKAAAVRYRKCARCPQLMNRVNFARLSGVIVDACRATK